MMVEAIDLPEYYLLHSIRADLLRRLGRIGEALLATRPRSRGRRMRQNVRSCSARRSLIEPAGTVG